MKIIRNSVVQIIGNKAKPGANLSFLKNMMNFCRDFNEKTKAKDGIMLRVEITVYFDNSFTYIIKNTPTSILLKKIDFKNYSNEEKDNQLILLANELKDYFNTQNINKIKKILMGTINSFNILSND